MAVGLLTGVALAAIAKVPAPSFVSNVLGGAPKGGSSKAAKSRFFIAKSLANSPLPGKWRLLYPHPRYRLVIPAEAVTTTG